MFGKIANQMTQILVDNKTISNDDQELYYYGIQQGLSIILNFVTLLFIGFVYRMFWESLLFTVAYIPLRRYAGGYHAKTPICCYFFSIAMMLTILPVMRWVNISSLIYCILLLLSLVSILFLAPVADHNKPLDEIEQQVYRHHSIVIAVSEAVISFLFLLTQQERMMKCIIWSMVSINIMLVLGWMKNRHITTLKKEG